MAPYKPEPFGVVSALFPPLVAIIGLLSDVINISGDLGKDGTFADERASLHEDVARLSSLCDIVNSRKNGSPELTAFKVIETCLASISKRLEKLESQIPATIFSIDVFKHGTIRRKLKENQASFDCQVSQFQLLLQISQAENLTQIATSGQNTVDAIRDFNEAVKAIIPASFQKLGEDFQSAFSSGLPSPLTTQALPIRIKIRVAGSPTAMALSYTVPGNASKEDIKKVVLGTLHKQLKYQDGLVVHLFAVIPNCHSVTPLGRRWTLFKEGTTIKELEADAGGEEWRLEYVYWGEGPFTLILVKDPEHSIVVPLPIAPGSPLNDTISRHVRPVRAIHVEQIWDFLEDKPADEVAVVANARAFEARFLLSIRDA